MVFRPATGLLLCATLWILLYDADSATLSSASVSTIRHPTLKDAPIISLCLSSRDFRPVGKRSLQGVLRLVCPNGYVLESVEIEPDVPFLHTHDVSADSVSCGTQSHSFIAWVPTLPQAVDLSHCNIHVLSSEDRLSVDLNNSTVQSVVLHVERGQAPATLPPIVEASLFPKLRVDSGPQVDDAVIDDEDVSFLQEQITLSSQSDFVEFEDSSLDRHQKRALQDTISVIQITERVRTLNLLKTQTKVIYELIIRPLISIMKHAIAYAAKKLLAMAMVLILTNLLGTLATVFSGTMLPLQPPNMMNPNQPVNPGMMGGMLSPNQIWSGSNPQMLPNGQLATAPPDGVSGIASALGGALGGGGAGAGPLGLAFIETQMHESIKRREEHPDVYPESVQEDNAARFEGAISIMLDTVVAKFDAMQQLLEEDSFLSDDLDEGIASFLQESLSGEGADAALDMDKVQAKLRTMVKVADATFASAAAQEMVRSRGSAKLTQKEYLEELANQRHRATTYNQMRMKAMDKAREIASQGASAEEWDRFQERMDQLIRNKHRLKFVTAPLMQIILPKLVDSLMQSITAMGKKSLIDGLSVDLTEMLIKQVTLTVSRDVTRRLIRKLTEELSHQVVQTVADVLMKDLTELTTKEVTASLVPELVYGLNTVIGKSVTRAPINDYYCHFCQKHQVYCEDCKSAMINDYYFDFYSSYFSRYYERYYTYYYSDYYAKLFANQMVNPSFWGGAEEVDEPVVNCVDSEDPECVSATKTPEQSSLDTGGGVKRH